VGHFGQSERLEKIGTGVERGKTADIDVVHSAGHRHRNFGAEERRGTTHVLDCVHGCGAGGFRLWVSFLGEAGTACSRGGVRFEEVVVAGDTPSTGQNVVPGGWRGSGA
jgi:hypothetical protein